MRALGVALLVVYAAVILQNVSFAAAGPDSSGYLNEARMFSRGRTSYVITPLRTLGLDRSWIPVFTPLGFTWGNAARGTMPPTYPPGLPLHFAFAAAIAGWKTAPFLVGPLAALLSGPLMYAVGRRLGLSPVLAVMGGAILLVLPQLVSHAVQPVSDVVAMFWGLVAVWCVLRAAQRPAFAIGAGVAFAVGVWVRPTNVVLAIPLVLFARGQWRLLARMAMAALPFGIALLAYQSHVYGGPLRSGYGAVPQLFSLGNAMQCARIFSRWMVTTGSPLLWPGGLLVIADRRTDRWLRAALPAWFLTVFALYCLWAPYDDWWSLRFLLPGTPGLIFGLLLPLQHLADRGPAALRAIAIGLAVIAVVRPAMLDRQYNVLHTDEQESIYRDAVLWAEPRLPQNAIMLAGGFSGPFFYYADRFCARADQLDDDRFQLLRAYAGVKGLRWYGMLLPGELGPGELPQRFSGRWTAAGHYRGVTLWRLDS